MYYIKHIYTLLILIIFSGCLSVQTIHKTYKRGNEALVKKYEKDENNIPFVSLEEDIEIAEREKIKDLLTKTLEYLNISLEGLIIINYHSGNDVEYYYFFVNGRKEYYYFHNFLFQPTELIINKEFIDISKEGFIVDVFNYFNSSDYLKKKIDINFCDFNSSSSLNVLKIEKNKIGLFYLNPFDMCDNNNAFDVLKGDKIVRWEFINTALKEHPEQ